MKFKTRAKQNPSTLVWDGKKGKPLCKFVNGEHSTDDKRTCGILEELGYEHDGVIEVEYVEVTESSETKDEEKSDEVKHEDKSYQDLVKLAVDKGYDATKGKKKPQLLEFLNNLEG